MKNLAMLIAIMAMSCSQKNATVNDQPLLAGESQVRLVTTTAGFSPIAIESNKAFETSSINKNNYDNKTSNMKLTEAETIRNKS